MGDQPYRTPVPCNADNKTNMIAYTYYPAATELHPEKPGVNRITWDDNGSKEESEWTEITREYFPSDPRNEQ